MGQVTVSSAHGIRGVVVRGVEPKNAVVVSQLRNYIQQGSLASLAAESPAPAASADSSNGVVAIGATLAEKLKVKVGDIVNVVAPITTGADSELSTRTGHFLIGTIVGSRIAS